MSRPEKAATSMTMGIASQKLICVASAETGEVRMAIV